LKLLIAIAIAALTAGLAVAPVTYASDTGYIYGRVVTKDGETFQGQIRWGDEEAFWHDIFNATKARNEHLADIDREVVDRLRRNRKDFWERFFTADHDDLRHVFAIRFGDVKKIEPGFGSNVTLTFRNDETIELRGGSNDVGARISVVDPKAGTQEIRWNRIRTVEFSEAPQKIARKIGEPLYGTVKTSRGEFTGHIQWDNDEALSIDRLDGSNRDGKVSIALGDIQSIRKHRRGALVTMFDGNEEYLYGSNDVNDENRGVVVKVPEIGSVKVGWDDFREVTFVQEAPNSGRGYADYGTGARLTGVVETRSGSHKGRIVFDLDESWDFEMLHGTNGKTEYLIPFRQIESVTPKGRYRTMIRLRSGLEVELEDSQDVSRDNNGLLVYADGRRPTYLEWRDVQSIRFSGR
jgi:hypothetical protein